MAVHLINQQYQASKAMTLMAEGDTVILTNDEIALEVIATLADRKITVAILARTAFEGKGRSANKAYEVISEDDWVRYTTSDESVISWG